MSLISLYPGPATSSVACFRLIAHDGEPLPALETLAGVAIPINWERRPVNAKGPVFQVGTAEVQNLVADQELTVRATKNGAEIRLATVRTLPDSLQPQGAELRIFLASCYNRLNKESRRAQDVFADMCKVYGTPHLKIFCGDQVYLDSPASHFITDFGLDEEEIVRNHVEHYVKTWGADQLDNAFIRGANVFTVDDHEYWNNAPYPNVTVPALLNDERRDQWSATAKVLMGMFQGLPEYIAKPFVVPPISLFVLDTRSNRTPKGKRVRFMTDGDMKELKKWVASLANTGPGLLVIGQPLLQDAKDKFLLPRTIEDYSLADYDQFAELLEILADAPRDIAILSGDVHFTRASTVTLLNGRRIIEIINSPLALVVGLGRATADDAKPLRKVPGAKSFAGAQYVTSSSFKSNADSAVAFTMKQSGQHVSVKVDLWPVSDSPGATRPHSSFDFDLF